MTFISSSLGPSKHRLVTDIQVNVYIGNKLSRPAFKMMYVEDYLNYFTVYL